MADPSGGLASTSVPFVTTNGRLTFTSNFEWKNTSFDTDHLQLQYGYDMCGEDFDIISWGSDPGACFLGAAMRLHWAASGPELILAERAIAYVAAYNFVVGGGSLIVEGDIGVFGKILSYNSVSTQGYGVPAIVDDVALTGQVANIASTNFTNAGVAGTYRLGYYLVCTTSAVGAGTIALTVTYNDGTAARTLTGVGVLMTATNKTTKWTNADIDGSLIRLGAGSIAYSVSVTGIYSTAQYALYATLERLS